MKRSWFGGFLLLILLLASLGTTWLMEEIHRPVARELRLAAGCALSGDWDSAQVLWEEAFGDWRKEKTLRLCFADHSPVEEIDSGFAQLGVYCREQETGDFAAACKTLAAQVEAVSGAHSLSWENLF